MISDLKHYVVSTFSGVSHKTDHPRRRFNKFFQLSRPTQPKVPRSVQTCIFQGGGGGPDQLNPKCQDLSKSAFSGWGGGVVVVQTNIPEILEWGHSRNFEHKFCHAILWKPLHRRESLTHYVCGD